VNLNGRHGSDLRFLDVVEAGNRQHTCIRPNEAERLT
jgi:hypothetical protein